MNPRFITVLSLVCLLLEVEDQDREGYFKIKRKKVEV